MYTYQSTCDVKCDDLPIFHPNDEVINGNPMNINKRSGALQLIHSIIFKPQRKYLLSGHIHCFTGKYKDTKG